MASKSLAKQATEPSPAPVVDVAIGTDINLEDAIADELLNDIDWQKVRAAMMQKVKARFFNWLTTGSDRPINISAFPELAVLPSSDDVEKAA
ncbi:MAG: hypothetical protein WCQ26_10090 [Pseudanabaena sp. ELA748]